MATSVQCGRESTCTVIGLHQRKKNNSDSAYFCVTAPLAGLPARARRDRSRLRAPRNFLPARWRAKISPSAKSADAARVSRTISERDLRESADAVRRLCANRSNRIAMCDGVFTVRKKLCTGRLPRHAGGRFEAQKRANRCRPIRAGGSDAPRRAAAARRSVSHFRLVSPRATACLGAAQDAKRGDARRLRRQASS